MFVPAASCRTSTRVGCVFAMRVSISKRLIWLAVPTAVACLGLASGRDASAQRADAGRAINTVRPPEPARAGQTVNPPPSNSVTSAASPTSSRRCPAGMRLVEGEYCPTVEQRCLRWLDPETQMRCAEFAPTRCLSTRRRHVAVCMDEYEYPNRRGVFPQVMVSWYGARRACEARNARLCDMSEWTFACEGEAMNPYPYGTSRDRAVCPMDRQTLRPDRSRLGNPATSADEASRLYEAVPSGTFDRCVSPFGIHDMTGNVDEWVHNESGQPFQSALKGGWWGPIRGRCRPATVAHNESFIYYQIGFRCCSTPR